MVRGKVRHGYGVLTSFHGEQFEGEWVDDELIKLRSENNPYYDIFVNTRMEIFKGKYDPKEETLIKEGQDHAIYVN